MLPSPVTRKERRSQLETGDAVRLVVAQNIRLSYSTQILCPQLIRHYRLIAAAQAQRDLEYTTFGTNDVKGIEKFHKYLVENKVTVGSLYNQLVGLMKYAKSPRFFELVIKGLEKEGNDGEEEKEKLPRLMQSVARKRNGDDTVSGEEEPALKEKKPSTKRETNNSNNKSPQKANKQTVPPPSQSIHSMPTRSSKRKVEGMNETESAEPKRKKAKQ